jgi:hypothetical protein
MPYQWISFSADRMESLSIKILHFSKTFISWFTVWAFNYVFAMIMSAILWLAIFLC